MDIFESKIGTWRHPLVRHPTAQILSNFDALEISLAPKTVVWVALMLRTWKFEEMAQRTKVKTHFFVYSKKRRTHNHTISYILIQLVMHHRKQCFKVQRICIRWSDSVLCTCMGSLMLLQCLSMFLNALGGRQWYFWQGCEVADLIVSDHEQNLL